MKNTLGAHTNEICCVRLCNETLDSINCREFLGYLRTSSCSSIPLHGVSCLVGWLVMCSHSCVHPLYFFISIHASLFLLDTCLYSHAQHTQSQVYQSVFEFILVVWPVYNSHVHWLCTSYQFLNVWVPLQS